MTTTQAGRELGGVSSEYVRGEILAGRMEANMTVRAGKRTVYRITPDQLEDYKARHWRRSARETSTQRNQPAQ